MKLIFGSIVWKVETGVLGWFKDIKNNIILFKISIIILILNIFIFHLIFYSEMGK